MSKMKHLLRKLHIGGGDLNEQQERLGQIRSVTSPNPAPNSTTSLAPDSPSVSSPSSSGAMGRLGAVDSAGDRTTGDGTDHKCMDFSFLEEEFQVQLAMAISATDPSGRDDAESAQIDAAKRMSLMRSPSRTASQDLVEFLTLQYWSYNVVGYDEKVMDGFYDVYGISPHLTLQGKMPMLVDLQAISISNDVDYEVILVNRQIDPELRQLEKQACNASMNSEVSENGLLSSGLIQRISDIVVQKMGGLVGGTDDMLRRWTLRSYQLRCSLNTIVLPIGRLDVGLSRHRALLFKVLADRINLPCILVKGSYYTGTDDGAVNLIKTDDGSEYIVDLMGAPGSLIPSEMPSSQLPKGGILVRSSTEITETPKIFLPEGDITQTMAISSNCDRVIKSGSSVSQNTSFTQEQQIESFENEFGKINKSRHYCVNSSGKATSAQRRKVEDVSKYVISASKDPGFAHKLHAVLLENGPSPSPAVGLEIGLQEQTHPANGSAGDGFRCHPNKLLSSHEHLLESSGAESSNRVFGYSKQKQFDYVSAQHKKELDTVMCIQNNVGRINKSGFGEVSQENLMEVSLDLHALSDDHSEKINPVLAEGPEWEISWEDLQIGERIGIGSYGEVYCAEWKGNKVAVKKFLAQDLSGDALIQFKSEVEIMLRMRHPNVVLFMGAVIRPPHFSILTEFLLRGSMYRLLHRSNTQPNEKRRLKMALDVAKGMNYLHTSHPTIVHRDLKSPNLLVDRNWVVKVCDFGLSRIKHHTFLSSKSTAGTPEWMAPEVIRNEPASEKCDIYSFGVILWELATCQIPWKGLNPMQVVGAVGFQNRHLEIPENIDPAAAQIISDCWHIEAHLRPSFSQLMSRLRHLEHLLDNGTKSQNQRTEWLQ